MTTASAVATLHEDTEADGRRRLHVLLLRRIGAVALLIALAVALAIYALEQHRQSRMAENLAVQRVAQFGALHGDSLAAPQSERASVIQASLDRFVAERLPQRDGRIVLARFYGSDGHELAQYVYAEHPQVPAAAAFLTRDMVKTSPGDDVIVNSVDIDGVEHFFVQVPLRVGADADIGRVAALYAPTPVSRREFRERVWGSVGVSVGIVAFTTAVLYPVMLRLLRRIVRLSDDLLDANLEMLGVVGSAIAKRDSDTDAHNYRVTIYSVRLAEALGLDVRTIQALMKGAFLHDVGKIGVADHILLKPGKLDADEFAEMQKHVRHGLDIVGRAAWLQDAAAVVGSHHEKFDGSGYGNQLREDDIPLTARIFAIVDVFDALTSRRPYKEPLAFDAAMEILERGRGIHFDPRLLDIFARIARRLHAHFANGDDARARETVHQMVGQYFKHDLATLL